MERSKDDEVSFGNSQDKASSVVLNFLLLLLLLFLEILGTAIQERIAVFKA